MFCWAWFAATGCSSALPHAHADTQTRLDLSVADADVWAFEIALTGELFGADELKTCQVQVAERLTPAQLTAARFFQARVLLDPGDNRVQVQCRTSSGALLSSPVRHYRVRLPASPQAVARIAAAAPSSPDNRAAQAATRTRTNNTAATSNQLILDASESTPNPSTQRAIIRYEWFAGEIEQGARLVGEEMRVTLPRPKHKQLFSLRVTDDRGQPDVARVLYRPAEDPGLDAELRSAVVYGVLPPLYGDQPLRAATHALPKLAELGVDVLWLAPLFGAPEGDFGYAVTDYFDVRSDYGDAADLRAFVARAHALGLRVLLDLPANHSSDQHPYFVEAKALGLRSHYFDFYARDTADQPTHYFDWVHLPNLNYDNPEVARFMQEATTFWLQSFKIDGYRLDAAWGIRERNPELWPQLSAALARTHPEPILIAEDSARDAYYQPPLFAAAYDWTTELGQHAWKDVFEAKPGIAQRLAAALQTAPNGVRTLRFLNNNDTGARFITRHGRDLTRVATAALLSLPGLPCLYSFDEVGAAFEPYSSPAPIRTDDPELRAFHKRWISLRHELRALRGTGFEIVHVSEQDEVLAFIRSDGDKRALVVLNFSGNPQQLSVTLSGKSWSSRTARELTSPTKHRTTLHAQALPLQLTGWDARVFVPE